MSANTLTPKKGGPRYRLIVQARSGHPAPLPALRMILKALGRRHGFRCVRIDVQPEGARGPGARGPTSTAQEGSP